MTSPKQVGEQAAAFTAKDQFGQEQTLTGLTSEKALLLVFYPFAFSGICTGELCSIRDDLSRFANDKVQVVGISCDPMFTQRAWADDQGYDFPLLSDFWPHGSIAQDYGVFNEDAGMAIRGTFLIDGSATITWSQVNGPGEARDFAGYDEAVAKLS
ncbi:MULTISPECIES: peroxiredoxin [Yimella]|uniref:Alkyl hydroperoxide reductase E n=1 Tax=Yimella lutea TaxID=587872 RepID=A0A542EIF7_9MICO|nr:MULTISPECIES: peroxiredoxin [Yimella]MCG8655038.1 peroxiredoxin [Yimella sp. NH-Cas1]RYG76279.1 peroxiredoxin [Yimella sp. RIT 621]TQJ15122.1 peroxiredoxin [Yimella lutea]